MKGVPGAPLMPDPATLHRTKIATVELYYSNQLHQAWTTDGEYLGPWNAVINKYDLETYGGNQRIVPQSLDFTEAHQAILRIFNTSLTETEACDRISCVIDTMRDYGYIINPVDKTQRELDPNYQNWLQVYHNFTTKHQLDWPKQFAQYQKLPKPKSS